jgi:FHA domain
MPFKKNDDGKLHEDEMPKTKLGAKAGTLSGSLSSTGKTIASSKGAPKGTPAQDALDQKTRIAGWEGNPIGEAKDSADARVDTDKTGTPTAFLGHGSNNKSGGAKPDKTQLHGVFERPSEEKGDQLQVVDDPVVGWLVVERGPGKGSAMAVGMGMNSVGRGSDQRISIKFGDNTISSNKHFFVSYDPRSREFGVHRGDGANLTYLNGEPIYGSERLSSFAQIEVGATTLRFIALCGDEFSWDE